MPRTRDMEHEDERVSLSAPASGAPTLRISARALLGLRIASACLFLFFTILLTYTCLTDGSPFRSSLLTPWMVTTLWDFYLVLLPLLLLILVRHRAEPLMGAFIVIFLCCLGSSATWGYIFTVLCYVRAGDPVARLLNL